MNCTPTQKLKLILSIVLFVCSITSTAQNTNAKYDKALADSLGADDNGMKMYVLVILKTGTNTTASKATSDSLFGGHMQNIKRMVADGKLAVAGPLRKNEKKLSWHFYTERKNS